MQFYYAIEGQQYGPVTAEEICRLVASGAITKRTPVWFADSPGLEGKSSPDNTGRRSVAGSIACAYCDTVLPAEEMFSLFGRWICISCKPGLEQFLKEGGDVGPLWRDGAMIVTSREGGFPHRCLVCNMRTGPHERVVKTMCRSTLYVGLVMQESVTLEFSLCRYHKNRWNGSVVAVIALLLLIAGMILMTSGRVYSATDIMVYGVILQIAGGAVWIFHSSYSGLKKRSGGLFWIGHAGQPFIESLPPLVVR